MQSHLADHDVRAQRAAKPNLAMAAHPMLALQRSAGNAAVASMLSVQRDGCGGGCGCGGSCGGGGGAKEEGDAGGGEHAG